MNRTQRKLELAKDLVASYYFGDDSEQFERQAGLAWDTAEVLLAKAETEASERGEELFGDDPHEAAPSHPAFAKSLEKKELKEKLDANIAAAKGIREKYGAGPDESLPALVDRLYCELAEAKSALYELSGVNCSAPVDDAIKGLRASMNEYDGLQTTVRDLRAELADVTAELARARESQEANEDASEELNNEQWRYATLAKEADKLREKLEETGAALSSEKKAFWESNQACANYKKSLEIRGRQISCLTAELVETRAELEALRARHVPAKRADELAGCKPSDLGSLDEPWPVAEKFRASAGDPIDRHGSLGGAPDSMIDLVKCTEAERIYKDTFGDVDEIGRELNDLMAFADKHTPHPGIISEVTPVAQDRFHGPLRFTINGTTEDECPTNIDIVCEARPDVHVCHCGSHCDEHTDMSGHTAVEVEP